MKGLIFTYVLAYGGTAVALFRPFYGLLIYVCFGILKPESLWFWAVPKGNYSRILSISILIGWALNGFGNWRLGRGRAIIVSMVGYWLVILIGAMTALDPNRGWLPVEPMAKTIIPILIGATLIDSTKQLRQLAWVIVLSQGYLAYEFNLVYYSGNLYTPEWTHAGLDNNSIAITMVTAVGLAFYLGLHAERWWHKLVAFAAAGLMAHVVLFSNSRGGMLSLMVTAVACGILTPKRPRDYIVLIFAVALVFRLAGPQVQDRWASTFVEKKEGGDRGGNRLRHWEACWDSMFRRPFGVGPRHWPITAPQYQLPYGQEAHSTWLQTGAELGWPGLFFLLGIYGNCLVRLWPLSREKTPVADPWIHYLARMVIAGLIGFLTSAQFVTVDGVELPYYLALIGAGTLRVASQSGPTPRTSLPTIRRSVMLLPFFRVQPTGGAKVRQIPT